MEKKYYDIIASIVKQNEKSLGCDPIMDDIVQDVYEHSKVVLGSVTNEDVIRAYLKKVVATSLITVPKKLKFDTKNRGRIIRNIEAIAKTVLPAETTTAEPQEATALEDNIEDKTLESLLAEDTSFDNKNVEINELEFETESDSIELDSNVQETISENLEFTVEEKTESEFINTAEPEIETEFELELESEIKEDLTIENESDNLNQFTEEDEFSFVDSDNALETVNEAESDNKLSVEDMTDNLNQIEDEKEEELLISNDETIIEMSEDHESVNADNDTLELEEIEEISLNDNSEVLLIEEEIEEVLDETDTIEQNIELTVEEASIKQTSPDVDKTLVDNMINGISSESENSPEITDESEDGLDILDDFVVETEDPNETVVLEENNTLSLETEDSPEEEDNLLQVNESESDLIEEEASDFTILETESELEVIDSQDTVEMDDKLELIDESTEDLTLEADEISALSEEDENTELLTESLDDTESIEVLSNEDDLTSVKDVENENDILIQEDTSVQAESIEFNTPNFKCFSFEPTTPDYDVDEIYADLKAYSEKYPNKHLMEICNLKYKEKHSVSEIAKTLVLSEEEVINTLNDIIELVKD